MKSKTSYFNRTLFFNLFKRFWPIFIGYFLIWVIILPVALGNRINYAILTSSFADIRYLIAYAAQQVLQTGVYGGVIMSGAFGMFIAMAAFSYLYSSRSVSMICSLPIKREGVFLSVFTSGLVWLIISNVVVFLIAIAVESACGILQIGYLLQWLALVTLANLFFYGFSTLCASFTGHILVLPVVYIVLNFTAFVVEQLIASLMTVFVYGANNGLSYNALFLSPVVKLLMKTSVQSVNETLSDGTVNAVAYNYTGWTAMIIYAAVGILFAALAMLIIKHRRMETAGDVVALKPLKPIFKYCLAFGCALVLGSIVYLSFFSNNSVYGMKSAMLLLLFMLLGGFIGYFAAEMLIQKTLHVFSGRKWLGFGISALIIAGIVFGVKFDAFGYERRMPDISEIKGVSISCQGQNSLFENADNVKSALAIHSDIIANKDINEQCRGNGNNNPDLYSYSVKYVYTLKNGDTFERSYNIYYPATKDILSLTDLMNSKEAVDYRKESKIPVTIYNVTNSYLSYFDKATNTEQSIQLTAAQAYELYTECILPDFDDGTMGKVYFVIDDKYRTNVYDCTVNITFSQRVKARNYTDDYFYTSLTVKSARTNAWVNEHFALNLCTIGESQTIQNAQNGGKNGVVYAKTVPDYN